MTRSDTIIGLAVNSWINGDRVIWPGADLSQCDLSGTDLVRAKLTGANLFGASLRDTDLRGANLFGAGLRRADLSDAGLRGADLRRADLSGADLRGADLRGADLSGADLSGADLSGADLSGAKIGGDTIAVHVTSADRGDYEFRLFKLADGSHKVHAGCRWMTIDDYRKHVAAEYPNADKARRTLAILDYFKAVIGK
jgi:uncharacterized protein YjbI with pentapeptide repeats